MSLVTSITERLNRSEALCGLLREKLSALESVFEQRCATPVEWGLSPYQKRLFGALLANRIATRDQLIQAITWDRGDCDVDLETIQVLLSRMRSKLAPHGVKITSIYGVGYSMSGAMKGDMR